MRRLLVGMTLALSLGLTMAGPAFGHVHGITPLRCVGVADDGANRTDTTPAAAANGGPIVGLIPRDVGNAPLTVGDGGFDTPACPAV
ncbi:MAG TPA: hypothetical protein VFJ80_01250 [Candidatus Limnocylindrales bacterium]|jgi:hypothetical protein|nr:hypothetical protein [Candidatus Limnocylindrales bacterium]